MAGRRHVRDRATFRANCRNRDLSASFPLSNSPTRPSSNPGLSHVIHLAAARGATASQPALAWGSLGKATTCLPTPGTTRIAHIEELIAATQLSLTADERATITAAFPADAVVGERYYAAVSGLLNR